MKSLHFCTPKLLAYIKKVETIKFCTFRTGFIPHYYKGDIVKINERRNGEDHLICKGLIESVNPLRKHIIDYYIAHFKETFNKIGLFPQEELEHYNRNFSPKHWFFKVAILKKYTKQDIKFLRGIRDKQKGVTPDYFFQLLDREFHFTLDPCASESNHKCERYYTKEDNGLEKDWLGETVFVNPPFSDITKWCKKCYKESQKSKFIKSREHMILTDVVMIIPVRSDTKYWHKWIMKAKEIRFCKGRVNFILPCEKCHEKTNKPINWRGKRICETCYQRITGKSKPGYGSTFPLAIVVFKKDWEDRLSPLKVSSFYHKKKELKKIYLCYSCVKFNTPKCFHNALNHEPKPPVKDCNYFQPSQSKITKFLEED